MAIDLHSGIGTISNMVFGNNTLNSMYSSILIISIILSIGAILLTCILVPSAKATKYNLFKLFMYLTLFNIVNVALYKGVIKNTMLEDESIKSSNIIMGGMSDLTSRQIYSNSHIPVDSSLIANIQEPMSGFGMPSQPLAQPLAQPAQQAQQAQPIRQTLDPSYINFN